MIDFHCHLDLYPDPQSVVLGCRTRSMRVLSVTTTPSAWTGTSALVTSEDMIQTALGFHPEVISSRKSELGLFEKLLPQVTHVGEIGLDGSKELSACWDDQLVVFKRILELSSLAGGKVLSIHSRRAVTHVLNCLENSSNAGTPVLHWFAGSAKELERAIGLRCWFSVGPAMLMSSKGKSLVSLMPRDRIVTETDGPFVRLNDRTALPWDVDLAVGILSELWRIPKDQAQLIVDGNGSKLLTMANSV